MAEQFLNLEGRDTFNVNNGYEKTKIINGGVPQNSDLNEQSSIDEERARKIMTEGFGSGKLNATDFLFSEDALAQESILKLLERENESGVLGTLWQDGFRLKLRGTDTVVATDTTPVYRKIPGAGTFKGRVYLCHAKQDYLDPNAKLTVRDINDINLIQIDTAVREKRVVDYYIDWSADNAAIPARIDSNNSVLLSDAGIFSGKISFADSLLSGFTGYLYYLGDITYDTETQTINQEACEMFAGNADNKLYTGGDAAHRRDTEICGLIYASDVTFSYDGLKASYTGAYSSTPHIITVAGDTYSVDVAKITIKETQGDNVEQLHVPAKNNYFSLASALTDKELTEDILMDGYATPEAALEAVMGTFVGLSDPIIEDDEGKYSAPILLYAKPESTGLDNTVTYHLRLSPSSVEPTNSEFPIALFRFILDGVITGGSPAFKLMLERTSISYFQDRRRYNINAETKIGASSKIKYANQERFVIKTSGVSVIAVNDLISISGTIYSAVSFDAGSQTLIMDFVSGTGTPSAGLTIQKKSSSSTGAGWEDAGTVSSILVDPEVNPIVEDFDYDFSSKGSHPDLPNHTVSTLDGFDVVPQPKSLSTIFAQIRGMFGLFLPKTSNRYPYAQWMQILKRGLRIQTIQTYLNAAITNVWSFVSPDAPVSSSGINIINFTFTGNENKEGLIRLIDGERTLRDDDENVQPIIRLSGTSQPNLPFAPMIHLIHTGNTDAATGAFGAMILLEGKNGLVALPKGETIGTPSKIVAIDGQTGTVLSTSVYGVNVFAIASFTSIGAASFSSGSVYFGPSAVLKIKEDVVVSSSFTSTFINNLIAGIIKVTSWSVGENGSTKKGKIILDTNVSGASEEADVTIQKDAGVTSSFTVLLSNLKKLLLDPGGTYDANLLHRHITVGISATPVGTIISSAVMPELVSGSIYRMLNNEKYLYCNGAELTKAAYATLCTALAYRFGSIDDDTVFNLPDLRGRFLRGVDERASVGDRTWDKDDHTPNHLSSQREPGAYQASVFKNVAAASSNTGQASTMHVGYSNIGNYSQQFAGADTFGNAAAGTNSVQTHTHPMGAITGGSENETRPNNVSVNYFIKVDNS